MQYAKSGENSSENSPEEDNKSLNWTRLAIGLALAIAGVVLVNASGLRINGGFIVGAPTLIIGGLLMSIATPERTEQ